MIDSDKLLVTPLHDIHLAASAKMVPFAGYSMPVNYPTGIIAEHRHCRTQAGLFDVSHMGQILVHGDNIAASLESLIPVDLVGLQPGKQKYGLLLNDRGGIEDDLMVINRGDHFMLIVNAACKQADLALLQGTLGDRLKFELLQQRALIALQGPAAASVLAELEHVSAGNGGEIESLLNQTRFMDVIDLSICDADCIASRSGYTGEDGFEISVHGDHAETVANNLLTDHRVISIGLGARDSLRMEAGLCLYGQDLSDTITPVEAGLKWALSPVRRSGGERAGGFPGDSLILDQLSKGTGKRLVGLLPEGKAPVRNGAALADAEGRNIGIVTSGGFSPSLERPISMGYVATELASPGTALQAEVRGKLLPVSVTTLPFVPHQYYRGKA